MRIATRSLAAPVLAVLIGTLSAAAFGAPQTFALDPAHTQVRINWNHAGFSNPGASFDVSAGTLVWDAEDPTRSSVSVSIPTASVDTRVPALDEIFKAQYFDAAAHPTITFESRRVERLAESGRYRIEGELTVRGVTRPVTLDARLNGSGKHPLMDAPAIGFDATGSVERSAFGMDAYVPVISDAVEIHITAEGVDPDALARARQ